jgi:outer membrane protein assembly factor BamB
MKKNLPWLASSLLVAAGAAAAADWPQWRGPGRDDVSKETGLLKAWPKDGPKLLWTFRDAGAGFSSVAVVGDVVYTMGADDKSEYIYALDTKTQKKLWNTEIGPVLKQDRGDGPRGTPTVDGDLVFGLDGQGYLICVKAATGEKVWLKKLKDDLGGEMMSGWGYSESPLVDGDQVAACPGGSKGTLAAFNKKTGEVLWRSKDLKDRASYSSVVAADIGGVHQYVYLSDADVVGVDAKDGHLLWRYAREGKTAVVPTPVVSGDGAVFVTSGYKVGCDLIQVAADGKDFKASQVQKNTNLVNHHGGVVLVGDYLYGYDDDKGIVCLNFKTTTVVWSEKPKHGKMSITYADGQLYCYGEKDGGVLLVEATPKGYKENGSFTIPEPQKKGSIWPHPVVANGKLYLRDQGLIFCYDVKDPAAP